MHKLIGIRVIRALRGPCCAVLSTAKTRWSILGPRRLVILFLVPGNINGCVGWDDSRGQETRRNKNLIPTSTGQDRQAGKKGNHAHQNSRGNSRPHRPHEPQGRKISGASGVDGVANGVNGVANGVDGVANGVDGVANGVDGVANGVDGVANGVDRVANGVDGVGKMGTWGQGAGSSKSCSYFPRGGMVRPAWNLATA